MATLIVNDEPIAIQVVKAAVGDLKSWLSGAEFTITPEEGSAFAGPDLESYVATTGVDGTATVAGDHTNVGLPVALMLAGVVLVTSAALVLRRRGQNR